MGLYPSGGFVAARLVLIVAAACLAILPAVWFGRFDPARARPRRAPAPDGGQTPIPVPATARGTGRARSLAYTPLALAPGRQRPAFRRLLAGEVRILMQGTSRWWWLVVAAASRSSPR